MNELIFMNPPASYRGAPFWAWNCKLDRDMLLRQIDTFITMGMGGFHIHCRTGLATEYLGDEFMGYVRDCVAYAKDKGLYAYLYDEDRYASGFAGGIVTKDHQYRARHIEFTPVKEGDGEILAVYDIVLVDGMLVSSNRIELCDTAKGTIWYAKKHVAADNSWSNNQAYVDTLNPKAIERFVAVTHERYKKYVGEYFGDIVPSIFTDEPQFTGFGQLRRPQDLNPVTIPFTDDLPKTFFDAYGIDMYDKLPEIIWELPDKELSQFRYQFRNHIAERFATAYADTIGKWCEKNNIKLTGHMMNEQTLSSQSGVLGEVMRSFRSFQIPGIDILCDNREYITAKQAQSAAHQYGRNEVMSELYGVTNWDFDFIGHKMQGDWQAALGITLRVHHLSWVSMAGEGKRDYPAAIGHQSPWYKEYPLIENHFARVNAVMRQGKPLVRIGIIHTVESYWMCCGPNSQTFLSRAEIEDGFEKIINWSLFNFYDFDLISESLLTELCTSPSSPLTVGEMQYETIIVPPTITLRSSTLQRLEIFKQMGGNLIFMGRVATYCDGEKSERASNLANTCQQVNMIESEFVSALEPMRLLDIRLQDGSRPDNMLYRMQVYGTERYVFIAHAYEKMREGFWEGIRNEPPYTEQISIIIKGHYSPTLFDTITGEITPYPAFHENGDTIILYDLSIHGSILLQLTPGNVSVSKSDTKKSYTVAQRLQTPITVTLEEPNVLLLDMAEYKLDDGDWRNKEELLHIDTLLRKELGFPAREEASAQPWVDTTEDTRPNVLSLRFLIDTDIDLTDVHIALEDAGMNTVFLDGEPIEMTADGWYVDEAIQTIPLPVIKAGKHECIVQIPFGKKAAVEYCYLLGNFAVYVNGTKTRLTKAVETIEFGDAAQQGFAFYGGNLIYYCEFESSGDEMVLQIPNYKASLLSVCMDGEEIGKIAWSPYKLNLGCPSKGTHSLQIKAFGNRFNTFGQLHNCDSRYSWFGSCAWRTKGSRFSYEYQLKPTGVLTAPIIWRVKESFNSKV